MSDHEDVDVLVTGPATVQLRAVVIDPMVEQMRCVRDLDGEHYYEFKLPDRERTVRFHADTFEDALSSARRRPHDAADDRNQLTDGTVQAGR